MGRKKGSLSPFSIKFQMEKYGLSEEEAKYKVKTFKKCNKEYWLSRGYSEDDAINEVKKFQQNSGKIAAKKKRENPELYSDRQTNQINFWIKLGFSEDEAEQKVSERQRTFSLEKCIEKYGEEEGRRKFEERQNKWQNSLKNHSPEFIEEMNKNKSVKISFIKKYGESKGLILYDDYIKQKALHENQIRKDKDSGKWFFEKYKDEEIANIEWKKWLNQPKKYSYEYFLKKFNDEQIAHQEYEKFIQDKKEFGKKITDGTWYKEKYGENWEYFYKKTFQHCGLASKLSLKFFIPLYKILRKEYRLSKI